MLRAFPWVLFWIKSIRGRPYVHHMYVNLPGILERRKTFEKNHRSLGNTQTEKGLINQPVKSLFLSFKSWLKLDKITYLMIIIYCKSNLFFPFSCAINFSGSIENQSLYQVFFTCSPGKSKMTARPAVVDLNETFQSSVVHRLYATTFGEYFGCPSWTGVVVQLAGTWL